MFPFRRPRRDITLLFDVGSSSVGAAIVEFRKHAAPSILFSVRVPIECCEGQSTDETFSRMLETLERASTDILRTLEDSIEEAVEVIEESEERVLKSSKQKPRRALIVLSVPWHMPSIQVVSKTFDEITPIKPDDIVGLVESALDKNKPSEDDGVQKPNEHVSLEERITSEQVNGYVVESAARMRGRTVSLGLFISRARPETLDLIEGPMKKTLAPHSTKFVSGTTATAEGVRELTESTTHAIINARGEALEWICVEDGRITEVEAVPLGINDTYRALSESGEVSVADAHSVVSKTKDDEKQEEDGRTSEILEAEALRWIEHVRALHKEGAPVKEVYVLAEDEAFMWVAGVVSRALRESGVDVRAINSLALKERVFVSKERYRDVYLEIYALALGARLQKRR